MSAALFSYVQGKGFHSQMLGLRIGAGSFSCKTDLELRHSKRYQLAAPVNFWWLSPDGSIRASQGMTRDISSSGVLVVTSDCPPSGTRIQMTVLLPRRDGSGHGMELHGEGTVIRLEESANPRQQKRRSEFAASVHFYPEIPDDSEHLSQAHSEPLQ